MAKFVYKMQNILNIKMRLGDAGKDRILAGKCKT